MHTRLRFIVVRREAQEHELATQCRIAERLASLLRCRFEGSFDAAEAGHDAAYLVPNDTVITLAEAARLGLHGAADLFGGVVPAPYMATKTITHPLVDEDAAAPAGWCPDFAERVRDAVLPGYSAFSLDDVRRGARMLLEAGPVRVKLAGGIGGAGQWLVGDERELDDALRAVEASAPADGGLVIERHLSGARTFSIGLLQVGSLTASYFGTQRTTRNRHGHEVYGGSTLTMVRGGFDALAEAVPDDDVRRAVALAQVYHAAALACFAGMFASRCNYDVVQGDDAEGRSLTGVLEQSWRIGGASSAEVLALQALHDDPALACVGVRAVERHGPLAATPPGATVFYAAEDPHVGPITKYAEVLPHADP